ncbi:MAG: hypothetical protein HY306_02765 [Nitrosomonadales bacterium]|nr:hypothetical protein [Nitrosomonadales bacterium]
MAFTVDWPNRAVWSDASISDFPATRSALRALEQTEIGLVYPSIFSWAKIALGGGAYMYSITLINGYVLHFSGTANRSISGGNFEGTIIAPGVQVTVNRAAAYAVTAVGGGAVAPRCLSTGAQIKNAINVTPAASIQITLDALDNAIQAAQNPSELKLLTVHAVYGSNDECNDECRWQVKNLVGI